MQEYPTGINLNEVGTSILEYGPTACGKTISSLTCPPPILLINTEEKDPREIIEPLNAGKKEIDVVSPEGFDDFMSYLMDLMLLAKEGKLKYRTIFHDGLTFGQVGFQTELEDSRALDRKDSKKYRGMIDRTRLEMPDIGVMNQIMLRSTRALTSFSKYGLLVICTATSDTGFKKWGGGNTIVPSLQYQGFPKLIHGLFPYIGYITKPFSYDASMNPILPKISFVSMEDDAGDSFMARCSSDKLTKAIAKHGPAPLDFEKILKVIRS